MVENHEKTTEKKVLRNIAEIKAELEIRANAYNAAINADDTKAAELEKLDNETSELEKSMPAPRFMQRHLNCSTNPRPCLRRRRL